MREVKWMACANRGFYVHLSTLAEVRERVLEHVNVLARPLVLQREKHPVVWTPVYANVTVIFSSTFTNTLRQANNFEKFHHILVSS